MTTTITTATALTTTIMEEASSQHLKIFIRNLFVVSDSKYSRQFYFLFWQTFFLFFLSKTLNISTKISPFEPHGALGLFRTYMSNCPSVIFWSKSLRLLKYIYVIVVIASLRCGRRTREAHLAECFVTFSRRIVFFFLFLSRLFIGLMLTMTNAF